MRGGWWIVRGCGAIAASWGLFALHRAVIGDVKIWVSRGREIDHRGFMTEFSALWPSGVCEDFSFTGVMLPDIYFDVVGSATVWQPRKDNAGMRNYTRVVTRELRLGEFFGYGSLRCCSNMDDAIIKPTRWKWINARNYHSVRVEANINFVENSCVFSIITFNYIPATSSLD